MPLSIETELRTAMATIEELVEAVRTIKGRAQSIVGGREDSLKEAARIVLDAEQAIAKTKRA
ncbi:MAG: hypothetical protein H8K03_09425 [Nitrospira sp.]|jgi:hypothetical protein